MNTIQSFIQAARERKAQEIVMGPDRPLQFRIGKDLIAVSGKDLSISDSKNFVAQILNEEEKRSLYQDFRVQGLKNLSGISFKFDFQIDFSGISGTVQLSDQTPKTWGFPRNVPESLMRPQGLHILTGPRRSGKSTAIVDIVNQCKNQNRNIACFVEGENQLLNLGSMNISQFPIEQLRKNHIPRGADVIIIDSDNAADCEKALELAEKGYNVLICLPI
jgi:Tfp pilus assembly pilus retraction ATPase PilT